MLKHHRIPLLLGAAVILCSLAVQPRPASNAVAAPEKSNVDFTGVQVEKNIAYLGPGREEKLDLYRPEKLEAGKKYPAIVIIHGGGWYSGEKSNAREQNFATTLARAGYISVSIDYGMASKGHAVWPQIIYDCKAAVQFLRKNAKRYQVDPNHIGAMGGSAGGHLALMVGLTSVTKTLTPPGPYQGVSSQVQAIGDFYGPANLITWDLDVKKYGNFVEWFLGAPKEQNRALWEQASPVYLVTSKSPPVLVVQGTEDEAVPVSQSQELAAKLAEKGVPSQLVLVKGAGHSFDFQPPQQDLRPIAIAFFDKYLKGAR